MTVGRPLRGFDCGCWLCPTGFDCGLLTFALRGFNCGLLAMPYGVLTVSVGFALQGVDTPPLSGGLTQRNPRIKTSQTPQLRKRFHSPTFLPNHKVGNFSGKKRGSGSRRGPTGSLVRRQTNSKRGVGLRYRKLGSSIQAHMPGGVNMSGFPLPLSAMLGGGCWSLHYREPLQRITGSEDHAHPSAVGCWGWGGGGAQR